MSNQSRRDELTKRQRIVGSFIAAALIAISFLVLYNPPSKSKVETDGRRVILNLVKEDQDATTPFLALFLGGLGILAFTLNGLRFSKISAAGLSAESGDPAEAAEEFYETPKEDRAEAEVTVNDKESPEPSESPVTYVEQDDGRYAIYSLPAVPATVLSDAVSNWPGGNGPDEITSFEFATRKTGKGNHPWTVKFKGKKAITVSYGGYGKTEPTVAPAE